MWCRALLAAVAITCTLTTVQADGPTQIKDILCVLILNGLQKEDLEVSLLRKLQRHNVNIDDMNNEATTKECEKFNKHSSINSDLNKTAPLKNYTDIGFKKDQITKRNDSNLYDITKDYFSKVKPNSSGKVNNEDVENFMNVWNMISRTKYIDETTTKAIESSTVYIPKTSNNRRSFEQIEHINRILEDFMNNLKITTTNRPTTNLVDYDLIARKIKELLASDNKATQKPVQALPADEANLRRHSNKDEPLMNATTESTREILKLNKNKNIHVEDKQANYEEKKILSDDIDPTNKETDNEELKVSNRNILKKEISTISEDIIRELSESVRAKVLQDLKNIIKTTEATKKSKITTKFTTVRTRTTVKPTETTTTAIPKPEIKENAVNDVLQKFMEMFQQFKTNKEMSTTDKVTTEETNIKTEEKPPTINVNVIKPIPFNITSVILNPYNQIHAPVIQTAVLPQDHYNLLNIHPLQNIVATKLDRVPQLNIYNTKNNIHVPAITIQTNSVEVHPLGLPAQHTFVYQNIVVTPKQRTRTQIVRYNSPTYKSVDKAIERKLDERKYKNLNGYPIGRVNYNTEFGIGKRDRSREYINEEYINERSKRKPIKYKEYSGPYHDRNERFHEKLERAEEWPRNTRNRYRSRENWKLDNKDRAYNDKQILISRQQLPISSGKQRLRYDDAHFRNFMRTQQKVNDMLERILATKTNSSFPRSVETTAT